MIFNEVQQDLFTVPQGYYLAHCISGDYALGAGIAVKFDEVYNMKFKLHRDYAATSLKPPCQRLEPGKVLLFVLAFAETVKMLGCGVIRDGDVGSLRIAPMQPNGQISSEVR